MNTSILHMTLICFVTVSPCILGGLTLGFSSIALPQLNLTLDAASWFSCLFSVVAPLGSLISGFVIDKYGRKPTLVFSVCPGMIGWLLIATHGDDIWQLFFGRILTGISTGAAFFPGQIFIAEFIELNPKLIFRRTSFTNIIPTSSFFGFFLVILLGALFSYKVVSFFAFIFSICAVTCIYSFIPESPLWLYRKGRQGDAEWSLKHLNLPYNLENYPLISNGKQIHTNIFDKLKRRDVHIPLFITCVYILFISLCGAGILTTYLIMLVDPNGSYSLQDSYNLSVISAFLLFASSIGVVFVVPFTGIRKVAIGSSIGMMISMLVYGVAYENLDSSVYAGAAHTMIVVSVFLAGLSYGFGLVTIPRSILGEIFPIDAKGFSAVSTILLYVVGSMAVKFHPILLLSLHGFVYVIYGAISASLALFLFYFLPETVGRTAVEINDDFCKKPLCRIIL